MAKTLTIKDPVSGENYTLEYTRKSVEIMEKQGFVAEEVDRKPMTMLPALFAGAFIARHRFVKKEVIDRIYARLPLSLIHICLLRERTRGHRGIFTALQG